MKLPHPFLAAVLTCVFTFVPVKVIAQSFEVTRLHKGRPIITKSMFESVGATDYEGSNINGPSVIRIPDWIPKARRASPEAKYYLYFAHHKGHYIRLAWASRIDGPWQLYNTGSDVIMGKRGVLDMGNDVELNLRNALTIRKHIASPDVHVDYENKRVIMYFHGSASHGGTPVSNQRSFVATSPWGLDFSSDVKPVILGRSYFRVFDHNGTLYGLSRNLLFTPRNSNDPWSIPYNFDSGKNLWKQQTTHFFDFKPENNRFRNSDVRHSGLYKSEDYLHIFFSAKGDTPERIFVISINLHVNDWERSVPAHPPIEVLRAREQWEGGDLSPRPSRSGMAKDIVNQLRDPYIFEDHGKLYMFYAGGGEQAIGLAIVKRVFE